MPVAAKLLRKKTIACKKFETVQTTIRTVLEDQKFDLTELQIHKRDLVSSQTKIIEAYDAICEECELDDVETYLAEFDEIKVKVTALLVSVDRAIECFSEASATTKENCETETKLCRDIKLPKLELPIFSGAIEDWLSFSDLFTATVHENKTLSEAQKLQYLKSVLKGDAAKIIQSMPIQNANYQIAWSLLSERYSNERELIFAHIRKLISQPNIREESATAILNLVDTTNECVRVLEVLGQSVTNFGEVLVVYIIQQKLDGETKLWWERNLKGNDIPTLTELTTFLKNHARSLQVKGSSHVRKSNSPRIASFAASVENMQKCVLCRENHGLFKCPKFLELSVENRVQTVKNKKLCFNCLGENHRVEMCKSKRACAMCGKRHNTLLHYKREGGSQQRSHSSESRQTIPTDSQNSSLIKNDQNVTSCFGHLTQYKQAMLATALIRVKGGNGDFELCRVLMDPGSQANFITESAVQRLGLIKQPANLQITCLGSTSSSSTQGLVKIIFTPHFDSKNTFETELFVLRKITSDMPNASCKGATFNHLRNLVLADPKCFETGPIDILLGVSMSFTLIKGDKLFGEEGTPFAINSVLGWLIAGPGQFENRAQSVSVNYTSLETDEIVKQFWEIESVPNTELFTREERLCEKHFVTTHTRDTSGRYIVRLPFKDNFSEFGNSRDAAVKRLLNLEKRFLKNQELYEDYKNFMREYEELGHMQLVSNSECGKSDREVFYLPHHPVFNENSETTRMRVVFDASAKSVSGVSLNDKLMTGPRVQQELFHIFVRFRTYPVAIMADITKMFRQIRVHAEDSNFQRIVWREKPSEEIRDYCLNTVTYGTACAPFLATRTIQQLAIDEKNNFPLASEKTLQDFYVDDFLSGTKEVEEAMKLTTEMVEMMQKGGFQLRKWTSNIPSVIECVPSELRAIQIELKPEVCPVVKVLGVIWNPKTDEFAITVTPLAIKAESTKREILSAIARIFDPLGWLAPLIVCAKILLQELWRFQLSWDEPVPEALYRRWNKICAELSILQTLRIPRTVMQRNSVFEIHAFCDASEKAYGAVIYVRSKTKDGNVSVRLLTAKTRVAPLKAVTLPRLELCAALVLCRLVKVLTVALDIQTIQIYAWTDSTIVLSWLQSEPRRWHTFVANRVSEIQQLMPLTVWNHVKGAENPADCLSRGLLPAELINYNLWWNGPQWLNEPNLVLSEYDTFVNVEAALSEERKVAVCSTSQIKDELSVISDTSSYSKLQRIVAWGLRFGKNCRKSITDRNMKLLTRDELSEAEKCLVRITQSAHFHSEIQCIRQGKSLSRDSKIINLFPFIDSENILRVGGRLRHSKLPESQIHPVLLPKKGHLTKLIVQFYHLKYLHAGPQLLLATIQQKFWIINGRDFVRRIIRECVTCFRLSAQTANQIMADLPTKRVTPSRPFTVTGVDCAGPFSYKIRSGRGQKTFKCYVTLFICFSTRAIHLEIVTDLSSPAFIAAFKRFISRRGKPTEMISDCGTNFVGASRELKSIVRFMANSQAEESVASFMAREGVQWSFNPPAAPHFGGLWEAGVKSMKYHLKRIIGISLLTLEEFSTILTQVEACLNSRPLCALTSDPSDFSVLTPGHFLIGAPLTALPEPDVTELPLSRLGRWQLVQRTFQHFWRRWSQEYLARLQQRPRWCVERPNIKVGDLVLIKGDNIPALRWKLGRVLAEFPGSDGKVRVVTVKTSTGELKRPITKLCQLPFSG